MRRPAVGLGLVFACGVGGGLTVPTAPDGLLLAFGCCSALWLVSLVLLSMGRLRWAVPGLFLTVGVLGFTLAVRPTGDRGLDAVLGVAARRWENCIVTGVVNRDPGDSSGREVANRTYFGLQAGTVTVSGATHPVVESLSVTLYGTPKSPPVFGEHWRLSGTLSRHVWKGRVEWRFHGGLRKAERSAPKETTLQAFAQWLRRGASAILSHGIEEMDGVTGVVQALLLGYRARLDPAIKRSFANTGTMHIFAISGLHVAILCSVLVFAIGLCGLPRTGWVFALAPLILLYAITTGCRASAIRAGVMASAYLLAPALRRRPDVVSAMALAAIGILAWQPVQLFDIGCILSFAAVAGILTMVPVLDAMLLHWLRTDPLAVPGLTQGAPWWRPLALWTGRLATVSVAAWLTSVPLSLYFFGRFSPIALVANLIVVPMSFLIIVTGCLSLVAGAGIGLWLAGIFNSANAVFVRLLIGGMRLLEAVPGGHTEDARISLAGMFIWYALLIYTALLLRDWVEERRPVSTGISD
jgi:ComEC/Rec2-related protein